MKKGFLFGANKVTGWSSEMFISQSHKANWSNGRMMLKVQPLHNFSCTGGGIATTTPSTPHHLHTIKLIVNYYRAYICHQPEVVGRYQNIGLRRSWGPIFVDYPQLRAGGKNICPVIINNKRYCQFTLYHIWYSAFFSQVYSVFKLAAKYGICLHAALRANMPSHLCNAQIKW